MNEENDKNVGVEMSPYYIGVKIIKAWPQECQKDNHNSKIGDPGYTVKYEDGYKSWSPKDTFDAAYCKTSGMNFGLAMEAMKKGSSVMRKGWNGNGMYCRSQLPDEGSKMTHPYLFITVPGYEEGARLLPWQPAQVDLFALDWQIVN